MFYCIEIYRGNYSDMVIYSFTLRDIYFCQFDPNLTIISVTARNDFFAVGVGGIASSLVSSMPVSGCFSRSSLNFES